MSCTGPLTHGCLINTYSTLKVFSLSCDFFNNVFFPRTYFVVRMLYVIHITYKIGVNGPFMFGKIASQQ